MRKAGALLAATAAAIAVGVSWLVFQPSGPQAARCAGVQAGRCLFVPGRDRCLNTGYAHAHMVLCSRDAALRRH